MSDLSQSNQKRVYFLPLYIGAISIALLIGYLTSREAVAKSNLLIKKQLVQFKVNSSTQPVLQADTPTTNGASAHSSNPMIDYLVTLDLLKKNYYGMQFDEAKVQKLTYNAIDGMLLNLHDPFTSFMTPTEWNQFQTTTTRGDFEGIGAMLMQKGPYVEIEEPIKTSPAEKAGLRAGDIISAVNGTPVTGKSLTAVVNIIKGPAHTYVHLTIVRGKSTLHFSIMRALVKPPIVEYWMEDNKYKIGHVVLDEFNEQTFTQLNLALGALMKQGMRALVFDLRYNPGGLVTQAIKTASIFVPRGTDPALKNNAMIIQKGNGKQTGKKLEHVNTPYRPMPLAILVNGDTASASEIVSGCVSNYHMGTLIGQRTYGKGCVQTLFPLDDGSCLRLTTDLYYTPDHYDLNYKIDDNFNRIPGSGGLVPNIHVLPSPNWIPADFDDKKNDTQLHAALTFLRDRLNKIPLAQAEKMVEQKYGPKSNSQLSKRI